MPTKNYKKWVVFFLIMVSFATCKKNSNTTLDDQVNNSKFTVAAAKDWYEKFVKSPGSVNFISQNSSTKSYKEPNWENSTYKKLGNTELIEFPLVISNKFVPIPNTNLLPEDKKRLAASSLTKVTFIKSGGKITIREIDYVPEWDYLKQKGFNINASSLLDAESDFTGMVFVKEWSNTISSIQILKNGKITGTGKSMPSKNNTTIGARLTENCLQQFCWVTYDCDEDGDGIIEAWEECVVVDIHDCFWVNVCPEEEQACENLTSEECVCLIYGICDLDEEEYDLVAEAATTSEMLSTSSQPGSKNVSFSSVEPTLSDAPFSWIVVKNAYSAWEVTSSDIAKGYNSTNTGAIIYDIEHIGSVISGLTTMPRQRMNPSPKPLPPLIVLSWTETSHSKTIASNYKSGTITVSGTLKNWGIPVSSHTQTCTVNV